METFSKATVEKFLRDHGFNQFTSKKGTVVWISRDDTVIVNLKDGFERIDFDHFEAIAIDQVGIGSTEFDYWLGENT